MDIIEKRANKKRLHGVKFKFDTNNLGIRDCSTEDMKKYLTSMINEMFSKAGLYYNKIYFKPDNNSIFIQVLRNDFSIMDFGDDFREVYLDDGHKIFYDFTIGMQSIYTDNWEDITDQVCADIMSNVSWLEDYNVINKIQ